ncbi:MAG: helix-turn-helix domain-containing protein [Candidatus Buchananbacteria bacterium]|nr:helix-turn-helix domain-containing protein [Candidatus Buchananbacteria bacterium]
MTGFKLKNIKTDLTVGERLRQQRINLNLTLEVAATETKITVDYLKALENSQYTKLPGDVYARNFLKSYASWLGLDAEDLLAKYISETKIFSKTKQPELDRDFGKPVEKIGKWNLVATPKLIRNVAIVILAFSCLVYLGFKIQKIFSPPILELDSPAGDIVIDQKLIEITGHSEIGAVVKINGQKVLIDEAGNFKETLGLQSGNNIIEVTAQKKHSRISEIDRQIVVNDNLQYLDN